ncbi:hypothetical protein [Streptomyces natalensis]|uniref:hypothetical protein n=1 Tax=Streptomyces natalensis TaxID=68242 RepID=UPI000A845CA9
MTLPDSRSAGREAVEAITYRVAVSERDRSAVIKSEFSSDTVFEVVDSEDGFTIRPTRLDPPVRRNLVAYAGLVPVMRLAERCGLARLTAQKVALSGAKNSAGAAADAKVTSIVAGMAAGAYTAEPSKARSTAGSRASARSTRCSLPSAPPPAGQ